MTCILSRPAVDQYVRDVILTEESARKITAHTCFVEAGSWVLTFRGLNRLHQFDKVEVVRFVARFLRYPWRNGGTRWVFGKAQIAGLSSPSLYLIWATSALTYDFEVLLCRPKMWLEVSSVSNFWKQYQANHLKLRHKVDGKNINAHTRWWLGVGGTWILAAILKIANRRRS
jgi:seryl-tRNA synthetase